MKKLIPLLSLCIALWSPASARDLKYDIFEDWKALGYLLRIEDTGPMSMAFTFDADYRDVYYHALNHFPKLGFFIEKKAQSEGTCMVMTDWKTKAVGGFMGFLSGYSAVRIRIAANICDASPGVQIQARMDLEVGDGDRTWRPESTTSARDELRTVVAALMFRPLYGDYPGPLNEYIPKYVKGDETFMSREQFWKTYNLSGFKSIQPPEPAGASTPTTPPPPPNAVKVQALAGKIKLREVANIQASKPVIVSLAEDESGQRAVQFDLAGSVATVFTADFLALSESIKTANQLRATLQPGETELGSPVTNGSSSLQVGAKVTTGKKPERLLLLNHTDSAGTQRVELRDDQVKQLLEAADKGRAFCVEARDRGESR